MTTLTLWLGEPPASKPALRLWLGSTLLVFGCWVIIPILLGVRFDAEYLSISLSLRNAAVLTSFSFGEEFVYRVLPIVAVLSLFPKKTCISLVVAIVVAYPFGIWHEWVYTAKTFLGLGGVILAVVYLKFGGASGKPFRGFVACGSIHTACNFAVVLIANIMTR